MKGETPTKALYEEKLTPPHGFSGSNYTLSAGDLFKKKLAFLRVYSEIEP
jgi:glycerol-3-phosphate O-acyltransferase